MVGPVFVFLFLFDLLCLYSFGFNAASSIGLSSSPVLLKHRTIVEIFEGWDLGDDGLSVGTDLTDELIALTVQDLKLGNFAKDFI